MKKAKSGALCFCVHTWRAWGCCLAVVSATSPVWAQPPERPTAQTLEAKVALPARFSDLQFFEAISRALQKRVVAPALDAPTLARLNNALGGRELTVKELARRYFEVVGGGFLADTEFLAVGSLPALVPVRARTLAPPYEPLLDLLLALSPEQIGQMYFKGTLTPNDLSTQQRPLYLKALRASHAFAFASADDKGLADEQLLKQPLRFYFASTASMQVKPESGETVGWLGLYDYGNGLIWNALAPSQFILPTEPTELKRGQTPPLEAISRIPGAPLDFAQWQALTLRQLLAALEDSTGRKFVYDSALDAPKMDAKQFLIAAGRYTPTELARAIALSFGLRLQSQGETIRLTSAWKPRFSVPSKIERAQSQLRRLPNAPGLPFFSYQFDQNTVTPFAELLEAQQLYVRARLLNGGHKIDPSNSEVRLANTLWFTARSSDLTTVSVTTNIQLW